LNAVDLRDGIGLGMLSEDHPIKRDDLLKDIPDNKAFYPCAGARAKSHLKWAEAFWLLLGFKSNEISPIWFDTITKIILPFLGSMSLKRDSSEK